ncbi:hypothetical protein I8D64_04385 [Brachybacterium sp. MASK1Z-5]|uniref:DUF222 domain-containing protein n=1 Tax=Brachybacterium halotolerans TaxID=2795215 RepID=A0ABS1B7L2_9MICO|nr:hypothetical protein [Brachybacterium halotolerans]MBK0330635.1 hypothetical protein [Brachybacterium halotolerans]
MSGFLGCDTVQMQQLARRFESAATGLEARAGVLDAAGGLRWEGPDAEAFRAAATGAGRQLRARCATLHGLADDLRSQADEQERVSGAEGADGAQIDSGGALIGPGSGVDGLDLGAMARNDLFDLFEDATGLDEDGVHDLVEPHPLGYRDPEGMSRWVDETSSELAKKLFALAQRPVPGWLSPGKPFAHPIDPGLAEAVRERAAALDAPVRPHDPSSDLDPGHEQQGSELRHSLLARVPYAGEAQAALDAREHVESMRGRMESFATEHGLGEETAPLFAAMRLSHAPDEALFGEKSAVGSMLSGTDQLLGGALQTKDEVGGALGDGDLPGAARAMETGAYRELGIAAHTATTTPITSFGPMISTQLKAEADILDSPIFRGTGIDGDEMRAHQREVDGFVEDFERRRTNLTDTEPLLEMRRRVAPMPWDE